jgi:ubiquinone/menaquinone biosynthesis C-methylase UbiE
MYGDAARFYDLIHAERGRDSRAEADLVLAELSRRRSPLSSILDVACGTGAHLLRFSETLEVHAIDASAQMLAVAAEVCPAAVLTQADMRAFDLGRRFDAVVSLFSGIGYLADLADLEAAIGAMARHLEPGGVLAIDGWIEPEAWLGESVHAESAHGDDLAVARVMRSRIDGVITTVEMRYTAASADGIETVDETHVMRLSDPAEFEAAYAAAGLTFERLPDLLHDGRAIYLGLAPF